MIRMKVAFVLRLVDDFSGQCIRRKKFRFFMEERAVHPVEKEEGLYVFLEPVETKVRIWIEGTDYYPCSVQIEKKLLDPEEPVAEVRLYGRPGGSFPYPCELLVGRLKSLSGKQKIPMEIYAERTRPTGLVFREYRNVGGAHWIFCQGYTKENLLGKPFVLGRGKDACVFVVLEKQGINEYRIEPDGKPPDRTETGTPLVRIYRSVTDRSGAYAVPVECGEEALIKEVMILQHTLPD